MTKTEQKYLLTLLKPNGFNLQHSKSARFYTIMKKLCKKGYIEIKRDDGNKTAKTYELTNSGRGMAMLIAKEPDTDPQFKKYAKTITMWW